MNSELHLTVCTDDDLDLLASLNKQLIEDEQHDNRMNVDQLKERMREFIHTDYSAYKFVARNDVVGYALINHRRKPSILGNFTCAGNLGGWGKASWHSRNY